MCRAFLWDRTLLFKGCELTNNSLVGHVEVLAISRISMSNCSTWLCCTAFLWQLMRYHVLHLLKNLKLQGREVSDADIVQWANLKVKNVGKSTRIDSFKVWVENRVILSSTNGFCFS